MIDKYCKTNTKRTLLAGVVDLKQKFHKGETDEQVASVYSKTELVALLRYNWNRITDDRRK